MPKYNELKHFNPAAVSQKFLDANGLQLATATMTTHFGMDDSVQEQDFGATPVKI